MLRTKVWVWTLRFRSQKFLLGPDWEWLSLLPVVLKATVGLTPGAQSWQDAGEGRAAFPEPVPLSPSQECAAGTLRRGAELGAAGALINAAAGLVLLERNLSSRDIKY